jgi:hypothetical protein
VPLDPEKVFMFPESYNQLRKEMFTYWNNDQCSIPNLWNRVSYYMAFDMHAFIEEMNTVLGGVLRLTVVVEGDEKFCDLVCSTFLKELRKRRGELNP